MLKRIITTVVLSDGRDERGRPVYHDPGTPVVLEAAEADRILTRFGGEDLGVVEPSGATEESGDRGADVAELRVGEEMPAEQPRAEPDRKARRKRNSE